LEEWKVGGWAKAKEQMNKKAGGFAGRQIQKRII